MSDERLVELFRLQFAGLDYWRLSKKWKEVRYAETARMAREAIGPDQSEIAVAKKTILALRDALEEMQEAWESYGMLAAVGIDIQNKATIALQMADAYLVWYGTGEEGKGDFSGLDWQIPPGEKPDS